MDYTIENKHLKVVISDKGGEMMSIYGKKTNFEYLWQGDAKYWSGRAYVLFPICGRLTDGKYTYKGKTYEMNLHGFVRKSTVKVLKQKAKSIVFNIKSNRETKKIYPFDFDFSICYYLKGAKVLNKLIVKNTGKKDLLFSIGGHPGFNVPLCKKADFSDHYIEFNKKCKPSQLIMSDTCYYTGKTKKFKLKNDKILKLKHELFNNDAIFLSNMSNAVTLKCDKTDRFVKVRYNDMTHLGFWHAPKTKAPYVCIEPWHGVPALDKKVDNFETKLEIMSLAPKKKYKTFIEIGVNE